MMLVGTGILWIGWNGFNGGDPYTASPDAGAAVLNTNLCTAVSMIVWVLLDYIYFKRPAVIGAVQGIITGLVAITPAAGFVAGWGALIIGILSGSIPWVCDSPLIDQAILMTSTDHPQLRKTPHQTPPTRRRHPRRLPHPSNRIASRRFLHRYIRHKGRHGRFCHRTPRWSRRRIRSTSMGPDRWCPLRHRLERLLDVRHHGLH